MPLRSHRPALGLAVLVFLTACTGAGPAPQPSELSPSASQSASPAPAPEPSPTVTASATAEPEPTAEAEPEPPLQQDAVPEIEGAARYRSELSIEEPDWGPGRVELEYRWLRDGKPIPGAGDLGYRLAAADIGRLVSVRISGYKPGFAESSQVSEAVGPVEPGRLRAVAPEISGSARVGRTLTGQVDPWGPGEVLLKWQWYRGSDKIAAATGQTYKLTPADLGKVIKLRVRGYADNYTTVSKYSEATGKVAPGLLDPTPTPLYSGTAKVGHTITALPKQWGPGEVKLAFQWFRGKEKISGATKASYPVVAADAGARLRVRVRGTKTGYDTVSKYSGYTSEIEPGDLRPVQPVIQGTAAVGQTLTVDAGDWGPGKVDLVVRWFADGLLLPRAAGTSLALAETEAGKVIVARVQGSKRGYYDRIVDSAPTQPVAFRQPR